MRQNHSLYYFQNRIFFLTSMTLPTEAIVGLPCGQLKGASILYKLSSNPLISLAFNLSPTLQAFLQAKVAIAFLQLSEQLVSSSTFSLQSFSIKKQKSSYCNSLLQTRGALIILNSVQRAFFFTSSNYQPSLRIIESFSYKTCLK